MKFDQTFIPAEGRMKYKSPYGTTTNLVRKSHASSSTYYNGDNTSNTDATGSTGNSGSTNIAFTVFLARTSHTFEGSAIAVSAQTDEIYAIGYANTSQTETYIYLDNVLGIPATGLTVSALNNGTPKTTLVVTVSSAITETQGVLQIPVGVNLYPNTASYLGNDSNAWSGNNIKVVNLEYSWNVTENATSSYVLDLDNELAGINCDKDGNILAGAIRPSCQATLYFGDEEVTDATYSGYCKNGTSQKVSGVTIDSTGKLTLGSDFSFEGTSLEITFSATYIGKTFTKIMTIEKSYPGADGTPATTRWISTDASAVKFNPNTSAYSPTEVSAIVYEQVGSGAPTSASTTLYWDLGKVPTLTSYTATGNITIMMRLDELYGVDYISFGLASGSTFYEIETVPIIMDGTNGEKGDTGASGATGRQGAAVRGPVNWYDAAEAYATSGTTRWFYNGSGETGTDSSQWIDIVLKDKVYYVCNTSFDYTGQTWDAISTYFTASDASYNFIATNLILADNAYIDFTTTQGLYVRNSGGTVTGGMQSANSNRDIVIWAGSTSGNTAIANAPFRVDQSGSMTATTGTFGCMTIGEDEEFGDNLNGSYSSLSRSGETILSPYGYKLYGKDTEGEVTVTITTGQTQIGDVNGVIDIATDSDNVLALNTNAAIKAGGGFRIPVNGTDTNIKIEIYSSMSEITNPDENTIYIIAN